MRDQPEPTSTDVAFAAIFAIVVIGAFVLLMSDFAGQVLREMFWRLAICRH